MALSDEFKASARPWEKNYPDGLKWDAEIPVTTMVKMFDDTAAANADKTCLNFMGKKLSYREVGQMVDRFAKSLQDQGIGKGSRVGLCLPNTPFYTIAYYGALKAGATVANFNPLYAEDEIRNQINDSKCDMMVTLNAKQILPKIEKSLDGTTSLKKVIVCDLADALPFFKSLAFRFMNAANAWRGKPVDTLKVKTDSTHMAFSKMLKSKGVLKPVDVKPEDLALLQYTGGTTGVPKAAMLSHANLTANIYQTENWFSAGKNEKSAKQDKMLIVLPLFHVFSMTVQMNQALKMGAELIMQPKFELPKVLKAIEEEKVTMFAGVPTIYKAFLDHKDLKQYDLSSVSLWMSGGAAMPKQTASAWKDLTGQVPVEGYGLSETSPLAFANPLDGSAKLGSIGLPVQQMEVKFTKLDKPEEEVAPGEEGEICLRGPQVMAGYLNRDDETKKVMTADGYFRTGDIGHMDESGYTYITDRVKDMINASGLKVFSLKVEKAIREHPSVSEVCVIGVPDEYRGENVKAFIAFKQGEKEVSPAEMKEFLKTRLAPYELPKLYDYRDSLPKTDVGKPDKKALRAEEAAKAEAVAVAKEKQQDAKAQAPAAKPGPRL